MIPYIEVKKCECCGRSDRAYRRKITSEMVSTMQKLKEHGGAGSLRLMFPGTPKASSDVSYARHWGLVVKGAERGSWYLTKKGYEFLAGEISVPKHVYIFGNSVMRKSNDTIKVDQALGRWDQ